MRSKIRVNLTLFVGWILIMAGGMEAASLRGRVVDIGLVENGEEGGIETVEVTARDPAKQIILAETAFTSSTGEYLIEGLPVGSEIEVVFDHPDYQKRKTNRLVNLNTDLTSLKNVFLIQAEGDKNYLAKLVNAVTKLSGGPDLDEAINLIRYLKEADSAFIFDQLDRADSPNGLGEEIRDLREQKGQVDVSKVKTKAHGGGGGGG